MLRIPLSTNFCCVLLCVATCQQTTTMEDKCEMSIFATPKVEDRSKISYNDLIRRVNEQDVLIKKLVLDRQNDCERLENFTKRITQLEADQIETKSLMFIKDRVISLLQNRVTDLEQYTRRPSIIIKGIETKPNENLKEEVTKLINECDSDVTMNDVDKFHRSGERVGNKQELIVRFKSHSAKEEFF